MNLSDIFCQGKAVSSLRRAFETGRLAHAYIFDGNDGIGKFTTAKAFAKLLLCQKPDNTPCTGQGANDIDSCGECESCRMLDADNHPDFHHIYKELVQFSSDAQNRKKQPIDLPIDVIREFLIEKMQIKPSLSASKVYVISESEKLNIASQNALLKILEEPPNKSFIILLCSKLDNLLPTTKSRSQIVHFGPLSEEKIIEKLPDINKTEAKYFARLTNGSIGQAAVLTKLEPSFYTLKKEFINKFSRFQLADAVDFAQWINTQAGAITESWLKMKAGSSKADLGRMAKKLFVSVLISALTDAMKVSLGGEDKLTNFDQLTDIKVINQRFGQVGCADLVEICYESVRFIDASVNEKLVFELMLLNCTNYDIIKV
ncbi:MAG: DNA polymerase III subunit delta' [Planctomycetaceae bacterium]|nr:DNA polymerase III subunit delta' [Planctomycetaceae bacterium]